MFADVYKYQHNISEPKSAICLKIYLTPKSTELKSELPGDFIVKNDANYYQKAAVDQQLLHLLELKSQIFSMGFCMGE